MDSVYLESSFFSACVSTRTTPKSVGWRSSSLEWWEERSAAYDLHVSNEVIKELSNPNFKNSAAALKMLHGLRVLDPIPEVSELAKLLVAERAMPSPSTGGDAIHVAMACVYEIRFMLSWNVRHLANVNKRHHLARVCKRAGYTPPTIVTPDIL